MVKRMKKRLLISIISILLFVDLIFIGGTYVWYSEDIDKIWNYICVHKYEDRIEGMFPGKVDIYTTDANEIVLRISPEISLDDCFSIALKFQNWRVHDSALHDFTLLTLVPVDALIDNPYGLFLRSVASFSYNEDNSDIVYIEISSGGYLSFKGSKISSFRVFDDAFSINTGVFIEIDDELALSKITEWHCRAGLYTEEQLSEIEARGIPVTVWGEEASS